MMESQRIEDLYFEGGLLTVTVHSAVIFSRTETFKAYCIIYANDKIFGGKGKSETIQHQGTPTWDFTWKSEISTLGTQKLPTTVKIEIWGERFIKDDFVGQVILPIVGFADTNVYELKLPILQKEGVSWNEDLYQGELELTIHFSVDVSSLMTEQEIDNLYKNLHLLRPEIPKVKSITEKWRVLQQLRQENAAHEEEHERKNRPERYVRLLQSGEMDLPKWERLSRRLLITDWLKEFADENGVESILYCLSKLHQKYISPVIEHTNKDEEELALMLVCLERVKGTKNLATQRSVRMLFQMLEFAGKRKKTDALIILNVLTHICRWVNPGIVLDAMKYFLFAHDDVVRELMNELFSGDNLLLKTNFFELIATTINAAIEIGMEKMEELRDDYYRHGLTFKALKDLQADFPDEELVDQVQAYIRDSNLRTNLILDFDTRSTVKKKTNGN